MAIRVFVEGDTEKRVLERIKQLAGYDLDYPKADGKDRINKRTRDVIGPLLDAQKPVRFLVLRDLDRHVGETAHGIVQSVSDSIRRMLIKRDFDDKPVSLAEHPEHPNIYTLEITKPDLKMALHIADYQWHGGFIKSTIDDYVPHLALNPETAMALARDARLDIEGDRLIRKITETIPVLLDQNGIQLTEAKDYVRLFAAVVKSHTSPPVFAAKTMAKAETARIENVFQPLMTALDFLRR
jgi:hypothetical protein